MEPGTITQASVFWLPLLVSASFAASIGAIVLLAAFMDFLRTDDGHPRFENDSSLLPGFVIGFVGVWCLMGLSPLPAWYGGTGFLFALAGYGYALWKTRDDGFAHGQVAAQLLGYPILGFLIWLPALVIGIVALALHWGMRPFHTKTAKPA